MHKMGLAIISRVGGNYVLCLHFLTSTIPAMINMASALILITLDGENHIFSTAKYMVDPRLQKYDSFAIEAHFK